MSVLLALAPAWAVEDTLQLGNGTGKLGQTIQVPLKLLSDQEVQGFVAAFDWDGTKLQGLNLVPGAVLAGADVVVPRIDPSYAVIGVVMDSDGKDGEIIPASTNPVLATLEVKALGPSGEDPEVVDLIFQDGKYATVDLGPLLQNIIVVGGLSIGVGEGLTLTNGKVTLLPAAEGTYYIRDEAFDPVDDVIPGFFGAAVKACVWLENSKPVQGFVTAIVHPAGITLVGIDVGAGVGPADFADAEGSPGQGGTLGVVMELDGIPPFRTIPPGLAPIAVYTYSSAKRACDAPAEEFQLEFKDLVLGDPLRENVIVIGGRSKNPDLMNGKLLLSVDKSDTTVCPPTTELTFAVGSCELVEGTTQDPTDPAKNLLEPGVVTGHAGDVVQVGFWYRSPDVDDEDEAHQTDHIQGLSMAACYDATKIECLETYSLAGTITEAVGAEFVNVHCENEMEQDDPGEIIIGILVDALPPFDGQTLPPTNEYLKLICVDFRINENVDCDETIPICFCDCADGRGDVPILNLASIDNHSVKPALKCGSVRVLAEPIFIRGDCNSSGDPGNCQGAVDISDAAAVIDFLFLTGTWKYNPQCLDACDANDDGRVDLADSVYILRYLFKFDKQPKPPFPGFGPDPTQDRLTCDGGTTCQ